MLNDRYRLTDHLATGGMGEVWRGVDTVLGRAVAVKVLQPGLLAEPGFSVRFEAEARMMAALQHSGIVNVFDYGQSALPSGVQAVYLVMEYVDGESLAARLNRQTRLDVATTMSVVEQAAEALHAAHLAGIVHRDVKPGNLLLQPDGAVRLVDFGVARSTTAAAGITGTNIVVGTALYMAPEQAAGRPVSPATDIYALGAVAYHCLVGYPPFSGGSSLEVAVKHLHDEVPPLPAEVPPAAAAVITRALAKDPADRFGTAEDLATAARTVRSEHADPAATTIVQAAAPVAGGSPTAKNAPLAASPAADGQPERRRAPVVVLAAGLIALAALAAALAFAPDAGSPPAGGGSGTSNQPGGSSADPETAGAGPGGPTPEPGGSRTPERSSAPADTGTAPAPSGSPGTTPTPDGSAPAGGGASGQSSSPQPQPSAPASPNSDGGGQPPAPVPTPSELAGGGGVASPTPVVATSPTAGATLPPVAGDPTVILA